MLWTRKERATGVLVAETNALLNARVDPRTTARVGRPMRLAVDPARFHFFDPERGASLSRERAAQPKSEAAIV